MLQKEIWIADLQENPIPDHSFVGASVDMSEHVDNNILHLQEAGIEPITHENFFKLNSNAELPIADIQDIPNEVPLSIFSTEVTIHRNLEEVELAYDKRASIVNRHKSSLAKAIGKRAAYAWTPSESNESNKLIKIGGDSIIDAIVDLRAFYMDLDQHESLNLCLTAEHWSRVKKEDSKLYKDLMAEKNKVYADFKIWNYSQSPVFTADGTKKPFDSMREETDVKSSFAWISNEVFTCIGDTEVYLEQGKARIQADLLSYGQRALVGNIRAASPKYLGAII